MKEGFCKGGDLLPEAVKAGKGGVFKMKPVGTFMGECRQGSIRT